jgi:hypothetical protein
MSLLNPNNLLDQWTTKDKLEGGGEEENKRNRGEVKIISLTLFLRKSSTSEASELPARWQKKWWTTKMMGK